MAYERAPGADEEELTEKEELRRIRLLLEKMWVDQIQTYPSPIGPKPKLTIWNYGHFITNFTLPANSWSTIWEKKTPDTPMMVYWKILVCNTPNFDCLCFQDNVPICEDGCSLAALFALGVNDYNDRGWCHIYDEVNSMYGLQCNILRPVRGKYEFRIRNRDSVDRECTVLYVKWYKWAREQYDLQYGPYGVDLSR